MKVTIELFGASRDFSNQDSLEFNIENNSTIKDIRNKIIDYLDKNFIFYYVKKEFNNKNIFLLYIFTSIFTTIIFWAIELWFSYYVNINYSEYLGALVGLTLGYSLKYLLDKQLVFNNQS